MRTFKTKPSGRPPVAPEIRFWAKVDKTPGHGPKGDCWPWTASLSNGYGDFDKGRAHRFSWELHFGPIPGGILICHHCDFRPCIRPTHLFKGSYQDNANDMTSKGRESHLHGELNGFSKLSAENVLRIRAEYVPRVVTLEALAQRYGVTDSTISAIIHRKLWSHVAYNQGAKNE